MLRSETAFFVIRACILKSAKGIKVHKVMQNSVSIYHEIHLPSGHTVPEFERTWSTVIIDRPFARDPTTLVSPKK
jgi:hypothetical protein